MSDDGLFTTKDADSCSGRDDVAADPAVTPGADDRDPTRRSVLRRGGRLLVYTAPLVQLFHPTQALAVSGLSPTS